MAGGREKGQMPTFIKARNENKYWPRSFLLKTDSWNGPKLLAAPKGTLKKSPIGR